MLAAALVSVFLQSAGAERAVSTSAANPTFAAGRSFTLPVFDGDAIIDGVLNEPEWAKAVALDGFTDYQPVEDARPSQATEVRVWRNQTHLYVGFIAHDDLASEIHATLSDRDTSLVDDWVGVLLDPFASGRRGVLLASNALGVQTDCLVAEDSNDCAWDMIFQSAGRIVSDGYVVEFAIPFSSLRIDPERETWGFEAEREIGRTGEQEVWTPIRASAGSLISQLGTMHGMKGTAGAVSGIVIPEITASTGPGVEGDRGLVREGVPNGLSRGSSQMDLGVTAKASRAGLTADVAVNPDFSQVESDPSRVTINQRFPLVYDEKRPLFLEGREYFADLLWNVVYTRSIVDPIYGAKLTGRIGPTSYAILNAVDQHPVDSTVDPTWVTSAYSGQSAVTSVARAVTDASDALTIGLVATDKRVAGISSQLLGPDVALHITKSWQTDAELLWSGTDDPNGSHVEGTAVKWRLHHADRNWNWFSYFDQVGSGFRAEAGFMPRVGYLEAGFDTGWKLFAGSSRGLAFVQAGCFGRVLNSTVNDDRNRDLATYFVLNFGHSSIQFIPGWYRERFARTDFLSRQVEMDVTSSWVKWLDLNLALSGGDQISYFQPTAPYLGSSVVANVSANFKPGTRVGAGVTYYREIFSRAHSLEPSGFRAGGVYDQSVARVSAQLFLTRFLSARIIEAESTVDYKLSHSALLEFRPGPGSIFYIGYSDAAPLNHGVDVSRDRALFVKIAWIVSR